MKGLVFETNGSRAGAAPNRTDVACFIGYARARDAKPPARLRAWLEQEGWWSTTTSAGIQPGGESLYDVPVPVNTLEQFEQLFQGGQRLFGHAGNAGATYLGAAVRSFFAQGGRRCFVISLGEPVPLSADRSRRDELILQLIPSRSTRSDDRRQWHGLHHLVGLPEVSFVALPDLAELASTHREELAPLVEVPPPEPQFVECSQPGAGQPESRVIHLGAPRCTDSEYGLWRTAVHRAVQWLSETRRDVQLLAALPLPHTASGAASDLLGFMHLQGWLTGTLQTTGSLATAFLQLGFPWLRLDYAGDLPGNLEPPEGVMAGLLARNALTRGTFRSASGVEVHQAIDAVPRLSQDEQFGPDPAAPPLASPQAPLIERVSLFGPTKKGLRLLSDVTTSSDVTYRQAGVSRTIGLVMRAARCIGQEIVFEASGERLWQRIEDRLADVLGAMQTAGALAGARPGDGFEVRCNRSTMTQQDIDNGRVIVRVLIRPAASIETMRIQLVIGSSGRVSLAAMGMEAA